MSETQTASATETTEQSTPDVSHQEVLDSLTATERAEWFKTGELPKREAKPAAQPAPGASDEDDEADGSEQQAQTQQPATSQQPQPGEKPVSKRQQHINDLIRKETESRVKAERLEQQIAELNARLAGGQTQQQQPAAVEPTRAKPVVADFETYEEFSEALTDWKIEQREAKQAAERAIAQQAAQQATQQQLEDQRAAAWVTRRDAFAAANTEFLSKAGPFLDTVTPGTPIGDALMLSELGPQIALHLAENPAEVQRIRALHPFQQLYELGAIEGQVKARQVSTSASAGPAAIKTVSTAPVPPPTVGHRSTEPVDEAAAALNRGDFRAYEAEMNRRELAKK